MYSHRPQRRPAPVTRIATWSATHPWRAIGGWVAFVAIIFAIGTAMGTQQTSFQDFWVGEAGEAESALQDASIAAPAVEKILITGDGTRLDPATAQDAADDAARQLSALPEVAEVADPITSDDGTAVMLAVTIAGPEHEASDHIDPIMDTVESLDAKHSGVHIIEAGDKAVSAQLDAQLGGDLGSAELFTLPITLLILFAVFGALLLAGVPLLLAISSIVASLGVYAISSHLFPDAGGAVTSVLMMMGMAVGVDYSLFYLKRAREERARLGGGLPFIKAVELAADTSGRTILVSGLAVIVSMCGLYLSGDVIFESLATACIIVVAIAMVSSLTVLPALLAVIGHRLDRKVMRRERAGRPARVWPALMRPALRHPAATLLIGLIVVIGLAIPALGMKLSVEGKEVWPKSLPAIAGYDRLVEAFPNEGVAHKVVATVDAEHATALTDAMNGLWEDTSDNPLFAGTDTPRLTVSADGRTAALDLPIPYPTSDPRTERSLDLLRGELVPDAFDGIDGARSWVSGEPAYAADYSRLQATHLPWVVGAVLFATFIMMLLAFRSVVLSALGLILNLASVLAVWGALVLVFQNHWAEGILGFDSPGFIGSRSPLMVFAILYGLSLDYQIFVVSRIREAARRGLSTTEAVRDGVLTSASVVTSAAVIMMSVFVAFMLIERIEMKQLGFTLALGVLLDAIVVRVMLLPAAMTLLGRFSWWPSRLARNPSRDPAASPKTLPATSRG